MLDQITMDQIIRTFAKMEIPVKVIDRNPNAVLTDPEDVAIRSSPLLRDERPGLVRGKLCLRVHHPDVILCCERNLSGGREILILASAMLRQMQITRSHEKEESEPDVYKQILLGNVTGEDMDTICDMQHMNRYGERRVMIFHILQSEAKKTYDILKEIAPVESSDVLVDLDRHTVVMVRDCSGGDTLDDALQYARALQETVMGETARTMTVGIGNCVSDMIQLPESYREARRAIEVGRTFSPETYIYAYSQLLLERFLMELPENTAANYLHILFNQKTDKILNEEMLYTIETFFKKDLNLSDTARQLYIHRNTLVYRLDKLYRNTGLDLRKFDDAVTFKVFMELKKSRAKEMIEEDGST